MARIRRLDHNTADRLLTGAVRPDDAPPGYFGVARLFEAAAPTPSGAAPPEAVLAAFAAGLTADRLITPASRRKPMLTKLLATKAAAVAFGAVTLSATGAAAATGHLPDPAQDKVAQVVSHVGIDLPSSASATAKAVHKAIDGTAPGAGRGKAVSDAAKAKHGADDKAKTDKAKADKAKADKAKADDATSDDKTTSDDTTKTTGQGSDTSTAVHKAIDGTEPGPDRGPAVSEAAHSSHPTSTSTTEADKGAHDTTTDGSHGTGGH